MVETFPEDPEVWSESLICDDGYWIVEYPNNSLHLDVVNKQSGEACIAGRYESFPITKFCLVALRFELNSEKDLRGYETINFLHLLQAAVNGNPAFSGECCIDIYSAAGTRIRKKFGTVPGVYESKVWNIHKDFESYDGSDIEKVLSRVTEISILCWVAPESCKYPPEYGHYGQRVFIDRIYFTKALGTLYVDSVPTGKTFTFDGRGFVTPHGFMGAVGDEHTVVMSDGEFVKWEDGSTSRTREVVIPDGKRAITAYYEEVPPEEEEEVPLIPREALIGLGIVAFSAVSLFAYGKYAKKR